MIRFRSYVLPFAIVMGILFHKFCAALNPVVPFIIFTILLLNFCAVDLKKLRFRWLHLWIMLFQIGVSVGGYCILNALGANEIISQGLLVGALCPVAASVVVVSCMLGADRVTVTSYVMIGNLMVSIVAPLIFTMIGVNPDMTMLGSFLLILRKISPTLALPFFISLALQHWFPKINSAIGSKASFSFYLWSFALFLTLGQTINFIFTNGEGNWKYIIILGVMSLTLCSVQFAFGKWLGSKYGDRISGGQLLGQKNSAMGIWMAITFLHPLASVIMAFYSIFQNLFNSWQIYRFDHEQKKAI